MDVKCFESSEKNVWKYVFTDEEKVLESVLYRYESFEKRAVICCSVQSGCAIGCTFCGTGNNFIKNISAEQIVAQVDYLMADKEINHEKIERFQIMFMSMGEPMLNWDNVEKAIYMLNKKYPTAKLLLSSIGVANDDIFKKIIETSKAVPNVGLQFSIHESTDSKRNKLIPYKHKWSLSEIRDRGMLWWKEVGRNPYLNYCVKDTNCGGEDVYNLATLFSPLIFHMTFSVVCEKDETLKDAHDTMKSTVEEFERKFKAMGYDTRTFDPAGQDDIGGGCGQLWYVQNYLNKKKEEELVEVVS